MGICHESVAVWNIPIQRGKKNLDIHRKFPSQYFHYYTLYLVEDYLGTNRSFSNPKSRVISENIYKPERINIHVDIDEILRTTEHAQLSRWLWVTCDHNEPIAQQYFACHSTSRARRETLLNRGEHSLLFARGIFTWVEHVMLCYDPMLRANNSKIYQCILFAHYIEMCNTNWGCWAHGRRVEVQMGYKLRRTTRACLQGNGIDLISETNHAATLELIKPGLIKLIIRHPFEYFGPDVQLFSLPKWELIAAVFKLIYSCIYILELTSNIAVVILRWVNYTAGYILRCQSTKWFWLKRV